MFCDDSGNHDMTGQQSGSDVVGAVGYVATVPGWQKFDPEWRIALKEYGVSVEDFHAFDLQWKRNAFTGWSDTRRDEFVDRLAKIISKHAAFGVGGFVLTKDFVGMPQTFKDEIRHPYFIGIHNLLNEFIKGPFVPELRGSKVDFFFERMKEFFEDEVRRAFARVREVKGSHVLGLVTTGCDPAQMLPLQAADLAAYHVRAEISRLKYKPQLQIRPAMEALRKKYRLDVAYSDRAALQDLFFKLAIWRAG